MQSFNEIQILGDIAGEPELIDMEEQSLRLNFTVETHERWVNRDGTPGGRTERHEVSKWGKVAVQLHRLLRPGVKVFINGRLSYFGDKAVIKARQVLVMPGREEVDDAA